MGGIVSSAEEHVKGGNSSSQERQEKSCNRKMICFSEMQEFHGPNRRPTVVLRIL